MVAATNRLKPKKWHPTNKVRPEIRREVNEIATSLVGDNQDVRPVMSASRVQPQFRAILVPLDGTPLGESALPRAVSIARRAGAELHVVHVHAPIQSIHYPYPRFDTGEREQKMRYLKMITRQIEDAGVRVIPRYLEQRLVAKALCEAGQKVDLVVAATHGYGWLGRLWHDSIIHELMNRLTTPLLIPRGNGLPPAIAPDQWLRRVLVPLDGSSQDEAALAAGTALGALYDASYSLVSVIHNQVVVPRFLRGGATWTQASALEYLLKMAQGMEQKLQPADVRVSIANGAVAQKIISLAESLSADCIAIARGSRSGLTDWLRPSVTRRVLQLAQLPVLVVGSKLSGQPAAGDAELSFSGAETRSASAISSRASSRK